MELLMNLKESKKYPLTNLVKNLNNNLTALQPPQSETTKIITYTLLATAVVGIMVYQYIREQELKNI